MFRDARSFNQSLIDWKVFITATWARMVLKRCEASAALTAMIDDGSFLVALQASDAAFAAVTIDEAATRAAIDLATHIFVVTTPGPTTPPTPAPTPRPTLAGAVGGAESSTKATGSSFGGSGGGGGGEVMVAGGGAAAGAVLLKLVAERVRQTGEPEGKVVAVLSNDPVAIASVAVDARVPPTELATELSEFRLEVKAGLINLDKKMQQMLDSKLGDREEIAKVLAAVKAGVARGDKLLAAVEAGAARDKKLAAAVQRDSKKLDDLKAAARREGAKLDNLNAAVREGLQRDESLRRRVERGIERDESLKKRMIKKYDFSLASVARRENPSGAFEPLEHHEDDQRSFRAERRPLGFGKTDLVCYTRTGRGVNPS